MARMLRPLAVAIFLAVFASSGCAEWHFRKEARKSSSSSGDSSSSSDLSGTIQPLVDGMQNASLHDWNFGHCSNVGRGVW